jgi:hypothetical protein
LAVNSVVTLAVASGPPNASSSVSRAIGTLQRLYRIRARRRKYRGDRSCKLRA